MNIELSAVSSYMYHFHFFRLVFSFSSILLSQALVTDRTEGIWERNLAAGVTALEITISHFAISGAVVVLFATEAVVVVYGVFETESLGSIWIIWMITFLQGVSGLTFGMNCFCIN